MGLKIGLIHVYAKKIINGFQINTYSNKKYYYF